MPHEDDPFSDLAAGLTPTLPVSAPSGQPVSPLGAGHAALSVAPAGDDAGPDPAARFAAHVAAAYSSDQPSLLSALAMANIPLDDSPSPSFTDAPPVASPSGGGAPALPAQPAQGPAPAPPAPASDGGGAGAPLDGAALLDELLQASASQAGPPLKISIRDPERVEVSRMGVPVGAFLTYLVRTESLEQPGKVVEVRRRFTDFDQLHKVLKERNRGFFFPPLPEKAFFESRLGWTDNLVKVRRVDLQAYMRTISGHPVLRACEELRLFLSHPDDLSACARWQQMLQHPAGDALRAALSGLGREGNAERALDRSLSGGLGGGGGGGGGGGPSANGAAAAGGGGGGGGGGLSFRMLRVKQSLMGVVAQKPRRPQAVLPPDEAQLRQAKEHFKELMVHLSNASATARSLVSNMEALCEDVGALGKGFGAMARFEEASSSSSGQYTPCGHAATRRAADLQRVGTATGHAHGVMKTFALRTAASLVFLHDYHVLVPEAISALEEREAALAVVELLREELADKDAALTRAQQHAAAAGAAHSSQQQQHQPYGAERGWPGLLPGSPPQGRQEQVAAQLRGAVSQLHSGVTQLQAGAQEKKAAQLAGAVTQLQEQIEAAQAHYELLKSRNLSELERLNLERAEDFGAALAHFSRVQAQLAAAVAEVWGSLGVGGGGAAAE